MSTPLAVARGCAILLLTLVAVNSAVVLGGRTLIPVSTTVALLAPPYGYPGPPADGMTTLDPWATVNIAYASDLYAARAIRAGALPLWNPYQGLGQPFAANGVSYLFHPVNWLHLVLPHPWWDLVYLMQWYLAAVFLWIYLRLVGVPDEPALVGAVAVLASGFFQGYATIRELTAAAAWWPLLLYGVERAMREPGWRWRHLVLALAVFCTITGGHPEAAFLSLFTALIYGIARLGIDRRVALARLIAVAPGAAAGLLLAAPEWVNFAQYAFTAYSVHPEGGDIGMAHLRPAALAAYVLPNLYGRILTQPFGAIPGWDWNRSPGWLPPAVAFLALTSLASLRRRRSFAACFSWAVAALTAAKIWGMPGVDLLGRLPLFERIGYPRFASFLLALSCAGLAGIGAWTLSELDRRRWRIWIAVWSVLIAAVAGFGLRPVWTAARRGSLFPEAWPTLAVFAGLGVVWAMAVPLGLWWVAARRPGEPRPLCWLAALGILLHGAAVACNGYTMTTFALLSGGGLAVFAAGALLLGLRRGPVPTGRLVAAGLGLVALPSSLALLTSHGLPSRYDVLARPPYIRALEDGSAANLFRSFSLDTAFQGNFALPFGVSSLNMLEAIMPHEAAGFLRDRLDSLPEPLLFVGSVSGRPPLDLVEQFWLNKRYFDLAGVRHLVTRRGSPERIAFRTGALLAPVWRRLTQPLEVTFRCPSDALSAVGVWLLGGVREPTGTMSLEILDENGAAVRRGTLNAAAVRDEALYEFPFETLRGAQGRTLRARLAFAPGKGRSPIFVAAYGDGSGRQFAMRIAAPSPELALAHDDPDTRVQIWENRAAIPRVFLAPTAHLASSWQDAQNQLPRADRLDREVWIERPLDPMPRGSASGQPGELLGFQLTPNTVSIRYRAAGPGILTTTDTWADGWRARVDGRETPVLRVDGVFRGVPIDGPGVRDVVFWYRPPRWSLSLGLAAAGALLLLGAQMTARAAEVSGRPAGGSRSAG